jgi:hypothetical protein
MQQVVAIQAEENSGPFQVSFLRQMHAPVHVFIHGEVDRERDAGAAQDCPLLRDQREDQEGQLAQSHYHRSIPPRHRDRALVLFVNQMVAVVCLENMVVNQGVSLERISEYAERPVHEITVQGPFKERGENNGASGSHCAPEKECHHRSNLLQERVPTNSTLVNCLMLFRDC